jgi:hypothetical protein
MTALSFLVSTLGGIAAGSTIYWALKDHQSRHWLPPAKAPEDGRVITLEGRMVAIGGQAPTLVDGRLGLAYVKQSFPLRRIGGGRPEKPRPPSGVSLPFILEGEGFRIRLGPLTITSTPGRGSGPGRVKEWDVEGVGRGHSWHFEDGDPVAVHGIFRRSTAEDGTPERDADGVEIWDATDPAIDGAGVRLDYGGHPPEHVLVEDSRSRAAGWAIGVGLAMSLFGGCILQL